MVNSTAVQFRRRGTPLQRYGKIFNTRMSIMKNQFLFLPSGYPSEGSSDKNSLNILATAFSVMPNGKWKCAPPDFSKARSTPSHHFVTVVRDIDSSLAQADLFVLVGFLYLQTAIFHAFLLLVYVSFFLPSLLIHSSFG